VLSDRYGVTVAPGRSMSRRDRAVNRTRGRVGRGIWTGEAGLAGLLSRRSKQTPVLQLYGSAVAAARDPYFMRRWRAGHAGRAFDAIVLHVYLIVRRLGGDPGPALAQAVFDAMFLDMDINLREMAWAICRLASATACDVEAFHGRSAGLRGGFGPMRRRRWRRFLPVISWACGAEPPSGSAAALVRWREGWRRALPTAMDALSRGMSGFYQAEEAAR